MKMNKSKELECICEELLEKYSLHLKECTKKGQAENVFFWRGKYDAIYELLMILDSPLWYKLHSDKFDNKNMGE